MKLLRISISTLAAAIAAAIAVPAAQAGTYDVLACDAAPGAANNSWTFETNSSTYVASSAACPSTSNRSGLLVTDKLGTGGPSASAAVFGQWIVRAPGGTTISRIRVRRYLNMDGGTGWRLYGRQADGTTITGETCTVQAGQDDCTVGGFGSAVLDRALNTTSVAYGFDCPTTGSGCNTGAMIHAASAAIYSANVTINDPTSPAIGAPTGDLVRASGFHKGTESVTFNGTDALGISARRLYVDGSLVASDAPTCNFTQLVPCSNPGTPVSLSADLNALADGSHTVQVAVVDAASNETRSAATSIVVDHTAPDVPQTLQAAARATTDAAFTASWTVPAGQVAPISAAHWRLCPDAGPCQTGTTPGSTVSGTLPAYGQYTLFVSLEDAAGNRGAETTLPLAYSAPAPPTPTATPTPPVATPTPTPPVATPTPVPSATPTPRANPRLKVTTATLKRSTRTVSAAGTTAAPVTGTVRIKLTYRVGRKARTKTLSASLKRGRYTARTRLSSTDARRATKLSVAVKYTGNSNYSGASTRRTVKVRR
ncbi:hypothetical protein C8N24_0298 [Solirubrobacter pauli]|uniref:Ig-like domain-containing protein n=1 Tax=Solirubrobacter pauli TaxID=166793 RepID=A0A660L9A7_9ACTN|nr:hypothetical protein [Solirubrobacter pauli]RKQ90493.1 hypothetical protein C8N24_0298 [Solirubrobacter pauli]